MDIEVDRSDLHHVRVVDEPPAPLADGDARLRIDGFALSSNNITYAVFGDAMQYWQFFPAATGADETAWGRVPVWGFAEVEESRCDDVVVGERLYGYFPMSSHLTVTPGKVDERGFRDNAPHRAPMAGAYNTYRRTAGDPAHRPGREPHQMLLFPLFFTAFLIDDFLADNGMFGADQVLLTSASSKTAIGTAFLLHARGAPRVVGLTSSANVAFVEGLGVYDEVRTYDAVTDIAAAPSALVDVAGNADVVHAVHRHLGEQLGHSMIVGGTHWDHQAQAGGDPPGPERRLFFAPAQISKRTQEWGQPGLDERIGEAWDRFATWCDGWIRFHDASGAGAVEAAYRELLEGRSAPDAGHICHLP